MEKLKNQNEINGKTIYPSIVMILVCVCTLLVLSLFVTSARVVILQNKLSKDEFENGVVSNVVVNSLRISVSRSPYPLSEAVLYAEAGNSEFKKNGDFKIGSRCYELAFAIQEKSSHPDIEADWWPIYCYMKYDFRDGQKKNEGDFMDKISDYTGKLFQNQDNPDSGFSRKEATTNAMTRLKDVRGRLSRMGIGTNAIPVINDAIREIESHIRDAKSIENPK
jgi:hypothetical protein